jgi:hypothetical protein
MVLTGSTLLNASSQHRSTSAVHVTEIIRRSHSQDERMRAAKNEKNGHDTYPASDGEPGCLEKICGMQQTPPVKTPQGCAGEVMHRRPNET